jgi:hypothetical protein
LKESFGYSANGISKKVSLKAIYPKMKKPRRMEMCGLFDLENDGDDLKDKKGRPENYRPTFCF